MVTKTLLQSICASSLAASKDETRYHLNHVRLEPTDQSLVIVATNGHWLSHITLPKDHAGDVLYQLTSPLHFDSDAIKRLQSELKLAPRHQETLDLDLRKYSTQDFKYPNWRQFIQSEATPTHTPIIGLSGEYLTDITKLFNLS